MTTTPHRLRNGSFGQNWNTTSQITVNDDWSGVPSIVGYRTGDVTAATGVDAQTILTDAGFVAQVFANSTTTTVSGGVTEAETGASLGGNPTIALQGANGNDYAAIVLYLDTTGVQNARLTANIRDLDAGGDNAAQQVVVQYRNGSSGNWINLAYFADVTTANAATQVTAIDVTLPDAADDQSDVQIRILTTNAAGNDELIGIDDIVVVSDPLVSALPALSIDDVTLTEGDAGTLTYLFTVSLSAPAGAGGVTFDIATADNTATLADGDYLANALTGQTIPAGSSTYSFSVTVNGDTVVEGNESFFVNLSNVTGATVADGQGLGTITNNDVPPAGTLAIGPATQSVAEGQAGATAITFQVTRTGGSAGTSTVSWAVVNGTTNAADFDGVNPLSGTLTFVDGDTEETITVYVQGDTAVEADEAFQVQLSGVTNSTLGAAAAAATVTNDDSAYAIAAGRGTEGGTVTLTVTRTGVLDATTLNYAVSLGGGDTASGADFPGALATGQVSFAANATTATITVATAEDAVAEGNETFTVTLSGAQPGQTITTAVATATITDNDGPIYHSLAGGSFAQDWSNTNLITADDDWGNVRSIVGYRGDELTTATGTNPATITGTSNVVDVIANQTNTGSTSGGVAEFQIADATIGLQGSGTADAPHIVLYLDATGRQDVTVSYRLRDLDGSTDNAAQQVALQYRVGGTGDWINVPSAFVNDATTGPSLLGPDTLVSAVLPAAAANQPNLQVRIITTNAAGNDEWVGIDDILVTSTQGPASLAIADASVLEGNQGSTPITFTVTRSGDSAGAVTADYAVQFTGNATAADLSAGQPLTGTVSFADGETAKTITVLVEGEEGPEANETFEVVLSNISTGLSTNARATGTIVNDDGTPPSVTISDVSQAEGNAGTTAFTFTVTRSGGLDPFTVDFATGGGTATAGVDYEATGGTLSFATGELSKTITVLVVGDTVGEPTETFGVQLTNATNFAIITDAAGTAAIINDDPIFIHDVQGSAYYSPILAADGISAFNVASTTTVIVQAVVTALDDDGARQGFYISEESDDWDLSFGTSEGIFVMTRNDASVGSLLTAAVPGLRVGDLVTVTAQVMEYQTFATMPRTVLVNATVAINMNGQPLPTMLLDASKPVPNSIVTAVTPDYTDATDGAADTFDFALYGLSYWESVEGMLVTIPDLVAADGFVQTAGGQPYFQAYSTVHADADQINSRGGYTIAGDPPLSPPDTVETDDGTVAGGRHLHDGDVNPDIIEVDFSGFAIDAPTGLADSLTMGDGIGDVTGIIDFDFTDRKLFVTSIDPTQFTNTVPVQETTAFGNDPRSLTVATFNVENLDPGDGAARFTAIAGAIATNLNAPDIISIEEMQDNNGADPSGGSDASVTWQMLVDALNAAVPGARYQWVDQAPVPGSEGGEPGGNIRVGFLYNTNRVQLGDLPADATIEQRRQFTDRIGDGVRDAGDRIAFSDQQVAGEINAADWSGTRLSLLGQFTFNGNTVYVTANHWPAKGGSGEPWQFNQNLEAGQPENSGWAKRNAVANDVYAVLNLIEAANTGAGIVAGGDFNDFYFYRPLEVVTGHVLPDGTARTGGARFDNLTVTELAEAERYTYTFDGRSQAIDHIIVNQKLSAVASYDVVHLNTGYNPRSTATDPNPALSDHDPAVASFDYSGFAERLSGTAGNDRIDAGAGDDILLLGAGGDDTIDGGTGNDAFVFGASLTAADQVDGGAGNDVLGIQGNYGGFRLGAGNLVNVETLALQSGSDMRFGDLANNRYDYAIATVEENVAAGQRLTVNAAMLLAGEDLTFNGSAETDGTFLIYGGLGIDRLAGGAGQDIFYMADGRYGAGDIFIGVGGDDIVVFRGDYDVTLEADTFAGIDTLSLTSAADTRFFAGGERYNYSVTSHDGNVAAGETLTINGSQLAADEVMRFDGSAETNGQYRLFAGRAADTLIAGAGADLLFGGLGADLLTGGGGLDTFRYQAAAESVGTARDTILDFALGDVLDLSRIDADGNAEGNQGFAFVGSAAFSGTAGELRAVNTGGSSWDVSADTDGDGVADFQVTVIVTDAHPLTGADFVL